MTIYFYETYPRPASACNPAKRGFNPSLDAEETDTSYLISVDLPGTNKADINISVKDNVLEITGKRALRAHGQNSSHLNEASSHSSEDAPFVVVDGQADSESTDGKSADPSTGHKDKKLKTHISERSFGSFNRSIKLPEDADSEHITASLEHGVLEVEIHKRPERVPQKIVIN